MPEAEGEEGGLPELLTRPVWERIPVADCEEREESEAEAEAEGLSDGVTSTVELAALVCDGTPTVAVGFPVALTAAEGESEFAAVEL